MAQLFPTGPIQNPWLAPKQIPSIQDYFKGGNIFAEKPLDTTPPTTQQTMTLAESTAKNGTAANPNSPVVQQAQAQQGPPPMNPVTGVAGAQQQQQQAAPANPFYTPQTPDGKFIAGAQVGDHYDTNGAYTWGIKAGDREGGGATLLTNYDGTKDHARWSYAQNSNENSWDHWDRLRHDLMKKYGMSIQQASDEALRQMYAAYQAAGKDWSETGFGVVPGVKANGNGAGAGNGTGAGAGSGAGSGSGTGTVPTSGDMGPYSTTQADVLLTGENGQDPYAALREAMRRNGINLDAPGLMSSYIKRRFQNVAEALMGTAGLGNGGDKYGEVNNLIQLLGQGLTTPGVNLGTALQQRAGGILNSQQFAQMMGGVDQNQAIDYLKTIEALNTFGAPDLMQAAAAANFNRLENQFRDTSFGLIGGDAYKNIPDFLTWLRQNAAPGTIPGF